MGLRNGTGMLHVLQRPGHLLLSFGIRLPVLGDGGGGQTAAVGLDQLPVAHQDSSPGR